MATIARVSVILVLIAILSCAQDFPPICYKPTDNATLTNAAFDEWFIFPVYINESTAQRYVIDNTTEWKFTFGYLSASAKGVNDTGSMYFQAELESTINGTILLAAYESAEFHVRASPEFGSLTIKDFSFPGFVRNRSVDPWTIQPASYNISISFAEFRTAQPPDSLSKGKSINKELNSNCTKITVVSSGSNVFAQYKPFTMEMIFYNGLRLWFDIPLSLNYSARYGTGTSIETFINCPNCPETPF